MFLTDNEIKQNIFHHNIRIDPFNEANLGPNSYDLTLSHHYKVLSRYHPTDDILIDKRGPLMEEETAIKESYSDSGPPRIYIHGGAYIIAATNEIIEVGNGYVGIVVPRSNLSYILDFHMSQLVDTGFRGRLSARIGNPHVVALKIPANLRIMQIMFAKISQVDTLYFNRKWSKNLNYMEVSVPQYKIDKEWLSKEETKHVKPLDNS